MIKAGDAAQRHAARMPSLYGGFLLAVRPMDAWVAFDLAMLSSPFPAYDVAMSGVIDGAATIRRAVVGSMLQQTDDFPTRANRGRLRVAGQ